MSKPVRHLPWSDCPRGFSLVEMLVVLSILAVLTPPFLAMISLSYRQFHSLTAQVDLKTEAEGAAARIFRRLAAGGNFRVDADNHGLTAGTTHVRWDNGQLIVRDGGASENLTTHSVTDFVVVQRGPRALELFITLTLRSPHTHREVARRSVHEYPESESLARPLRPAVGQVPAREVPSRRGQP